MRLVVFADLHLDASFAWARPDVARRRRQNLRDVLRRILAVADETGADAVLCAGDLYEHDRLSPDTRSFLCGALGAAGRPVLLAPGNHDWYGPRSAYVQLRWPENVRVFREDRLTPFELADGLTVWGAGFQGPVRPTGFFANGFAASRGGVNLGLFHGSERAGLAFEGGSKSPHAPFDAGEIERAGLCHAFVGHHHCPKSDEWLTYPGNPDPLAFGESGERGLVIADVAGDGGLRLERRSVAISQVHDVEVDVTGCSSSQEIRERVERDLRGLAGVARLTVSGELEPQVSWTRETLADLTHELDQLYVRAGRLRESYPLETIAKEPTVRGQFVRSVLAVDDLSEDERRRVLLTGLRALDGRDDLELPR